MIVFFVAKDKHYNYYIFPSLIVWRWWCKYYSFFVGPCSCLLRGYSTTFYCNLSCRGGTGFCAFRWFVACVLCVRVVFLLLLLLLFFFFFFVFFLFCFFLLVLCLKFCIYMYGSFWAYSLLFNSIQSVQTE